MEINQSGSDIRHQDLKGLIACPQCDLLLRGGDPGPGGRCYCPRCRSKLYQFKRNPVERTLVLSLSGLILFAPAMLLPIMRLNALGLEQSASIIEWVMALFRTGFPLVGLVVLLTVAAIPLARLLFLFYVSLSVRMGAKWMMAVSALRSFQRMEEWAMLEVSMLGILVSIIKLKDMAQISFGMGLFSFAFVLLASLIASSSFDEHRYWSLIGRD